MKESLIIGAAALALSGGAQASGNSVDDTETQTLARVAEICRQNPDIIKYLEHPEEICEISTDNGKTWILLTTALAVGLFGAGYSKRKKIQPYMVRFLNRKKSDKNIMDGPESAIIEAKHLEPIPVLPVSGAQAKTDWISRVKRILSKKQEPASSWIETVKITPEAVSAVILEEHNKKIQTLKDMFDSEPTDQDTIREFYHLADEIIADMTYSFDQRDDVRDWRQEFGTRLGDKESFAKTLPILPDVTIPSDEKNDGIVTLTDVHEPVLIVDQIRVDEMIPGASGANLGAVAENIALEMHTSKMGILKNSYDLFNARLISDENIPQWIADFHRNAVAVLSDVRCSEDDKNRIMAWGKAIDPDNATYATGGENGEILPSEEVSGMIDSIDEELRGSNFEFTISGNSTLARGVSDGGRGYMQDYVSISSDTDATTMVVLDGVSRGTTGATEQYVAEIGTALKYISLSDFMDSPDTCLTSDEFHRVATTVGRAYIKNNRIFFEKIGDVGVVVFDQYGGIKYQNIGGGYIPVDWMESDDIIDPTVPGQSHDIIDILHKDFPDQVENPPGPMKKREFMKAFSGYTRQLQPRNEENAERDIELMAMELADGDIVFMATDGVFDNLSVNHIGRLIMDKTSSTDAVDMVLSQLDRIWTSKMGDFGSFKPDNIGLCVYRHVVTSAPGITGPVDIVDIDI